MKAFEPFRLANSRKALILHYHRFSSSARPSATAVSVLEEQLVYLTTRYEIVPLAVIVDCLAKGAALPRRTAVITVDDGYHDFYDLAFPVLHRFKVPATVFVVAEFVDRNGWLWTDKIRHILRRAAAPSVALELASELRGELSAIRRLGSGSAGQANALDARVARFEEGRAGDEKAIAHAADNINAVLKTLPQAQREAVIDDLASNLGVILPEHPPADYSALSWEELREMAASGIDIGSHSMTHPILTLESNGHLRYELRESKSKIERLTGRAAPLFCYPNGDYDERTMRETERAGYIGAVTCRPGLNSAAENPFELRRIHTSDDLPHFLQSTSGMEQMKQAIKYREGNIYQENPGDRTIE
jgi:peptidoglycan/xylan/chitin deacetylase (PgdA/CDA1 family)